MRNSTRGQSELLGFVLIFSIVVLTISIVGVAGFEGLNNAEDFQRTTNAEYGFHALANDVDDVVRRGAPSRETEIGLADATLSLDESTTINVTVDDGDPETETIKYQPIVYDSGSGTTIVYSSGALFRQDGNSSLMFRRPNFRITEEEVVLPVVATDAVGDERVGGTTGVTVETESRTTETVVTGIENATVTIEVTTNHADAWERYLDTETDADCEDVDDQTESVVCELDTDRVHVTIEHVDVQFG